MKHHVVTLSREEMEEFLGLDPETSIDRVDVSFSPMMDEWSVVVELSDPKTRQGIDAVRAATEKLTEQYRDTLKDLEDG